jgi:hypothetical protein
MKTPQDENVSAIYAHASLQNGGDSWVELRVLEISRLKKTYDYGRGINMLGRRRGVFVIALLASIVIMGSGIVYGETLKEIDRPYEVILADDFEGYADIEALGRVWESLGKFELSSEMNRTAGGSKSLKSPPGAGVIGEARVFVDERDTWSVQETDGIQGRASVWIYTSEVSWEERATALVLWWKDGKRHELIVGLAGQPKFTMPEYFVVRDTGIGGTWTDTSVKWSPGWHNIVVDVTKDEGIRAYIGGKLVYQRKDWIAFHGFQLANKWDANDPSYYDDVTIVKYTE